MCDPGSTGRVGIVDPGSEILRTVAFTNFKGNDWYVFVFTADEFSGELIDSPEGRLEWIPDEKLLELNL